MRTLATLATLVATVIFVGPPRVSADKTKRTVVLTRIIRTSWVLLFAFAAATGARFGDARADTVFFEYTGNTFTVTDPTLGAPFVGSKITAMVEISNPVGGATYTSFDSFSLTAGPTTITDATVIWEMSANIKLTMV